MNKLHLAISTRDIEATVDDYSARFGAAPCTYVPGTYALWRTACLNISVRQDANVEPGTLRHLGWEDPGATAFSEETDSNGITWERFSAAQQANEINALWPEADYSPDD